MSARAVGGGGRLRRLWAAAWPALFYDLFVAVMFLAFTVSVVVAEPDDANNLPALSSLALVTFGGLLAGQVMALLRLRDWVMFLAWFGTWLVGSTLGCLGVGAAMEGGEADFLLFLFAWFLVLGPVFVIAGAWSLRAGRALFAGWVPLLYAAGAAVALAEHEGRVEAWRAGSKWAVWNAATIVVLALGIALFLVFLVIRERRRLALWRRAADGPLAPTLREDGRARPRLTVLGWALVGLLALVLTVGTALLAPYLWRTGPPPEDGIEVEGTGAGDGSGDAPGDERPADGGPGASADEAGTPAEGREDGEAQGGLAERARRQVVEDLRRPNPWWDLFLTLLTALVLFLVGLLLGWRPLRRILTVHALRRPDPRRSPTRRVLDGWRLVEIALADAGVAPRPGEPAARLVARAAPALARISPGGIGVEGLAEAAAIRDRVVYGLSVSADDVVFMEQAAGWAYDAVWDRLGDRAQVRAMYRRI